MNNFKQNPSRYKKLHSVSTTASNDPSVELNSEYLYLINVSILPVANVDNNSFCLQQLTLLVYDTDTNFKDSIISCII